MDDPFAAIDEECGVISDSQEQLLHRRPFLRETPSAARERLESEKVAAAAAACPQDDQQSNSPLVQQFPPLEDDAVYAQNGEQSTVPGGYAAVPVPSPACLADVLELFSGKVGRGLEERVDILDVAAMKGVDLRQPPRWWRPGGYASAAAAASGKGGRNRSK